MKKVIIAVAVVVVAWIAWSQLGPLKIEGPSIGGERVIEFDAATEFSVTDQLQKGTWVLVLFVDSSSESDRVTRQFEAMVRERNDKVRLVIVRVGSTSSPTATALELKSLPTAWLYHGASRRSDDIPEILKAMGG